jgi:hypothetical protein
VTHLHRVTHLDEGQQLRSQPDVTDCVEDLMIKLALPVRNGLAEGLANESPVHHVATRSSPSNGRA